jgi:hypothetical protein
VRIASPWVSHSAVEPTTSDMTNTEALMSTPPDPSERIYNTTHTTEPTRGWCSDRTPRPSGRRVSVGSDEGMEAVRNAAKSPCAAWHVHCGERHTAPLFLAASQGVSDDDPRLRR